MTTITQLKSPLLNSPEEEEEEEEETDSYSNFDIIYHVLYLLVFGLFVDLIAYYGLSCMSIDTANRLIKWRSKNSVGQKEYNIYIYKTEPRIKTHETHEEYLRIKCAAVPAPFIILCEVLIFFIIRAMYNCQLHGICPKNIHENMHEECIWVNNTQ